MENKEKDLIDRYLYDVVRRLPEKQRKDIEKELQTLIEDMVAARMEEGEVPREECVRQVLSQLGDPVKLARSYRGENSRLIGGEYFDKYCYTLKIVLLCVVFGMLVSDVVSILVHAVTMQPDMGNALITGGGVDIQNFAQSAWREMSSIVQIPLVMLQAFAIVTLIFAVMERKSVKMEDITEEWELEELPSLPYKKALIQRGESAFGIVFAMIFLVIFCFAPHIIGAWGMRDGKAYAIPLFNLGMWGSLLPFFVIPVVAGLVDDCVKLAAGRYTYPVMAVTIITDVVSFISFAILFTVLPVWNTDFVQNLSELTGKNINASFDILTYFPSSAFNYAFLAVLFVIILLDMGTTVYYTVRYGERQRG